MKPDPRFVTAQIERFSVLNFWPSDQNRSLQLTKELFAVLIRSHSDAQVTAVVNEWIESHADRPTPSELHDILTRYKRDAEQQILPDPNCPKCLGAGWEVIEVGGYSTAMNEPCLCWAPRKPGLIKRPT